MTSDRPGRHFRNIVGDLFSYGTLSVLANGANLLLLPVLTRFLGAGEYGAVDIVATFVSFLTSFVRLALPSALSRYLKDLPSQAEEDRLYSTLLWFNTALALAAFLVMAPLAGWIAPWLFDQPGYEHCLRIGCATASVSAIGALPRMHLRMERRVRMYGAVELSCTGTYFALACAAVVWGGLRVEGVVGAQLAAECVSLGLGLVATRSHLVRDVVRDMLQRSLRYGVPLVPTVVISQIHAQTDRLVLLGVSGLLGVGVFGAAARIAGIYQFALLAFRQSWQTYALVIIGEPDRDDVYRRTFNYYAGAASLGGILMTIAAPLLILAGTPPEYHDGVYVVPWLIGAGILHEASLFTKLGAVVTERTREIMVASFISLPVNVALTWAFVSLYGVRAAAIGTFLAEALFTTWLWLSTQRTSTIRFDTGRVIGAFVVYAIAGPALVFASVHLEPLALRIGVMAAIGCTALVALTWLTLDRNAIALVRRIATRRRRVRGS